MLAYKLLTASVVAAMLSTASLAVQAAPGNGPEGFNSPASPAPRFERGFGPNCPYFMGHHYRNFRGHCGYGYGYGPRGGAFLEELKGDADYAPLVKELEEVQKLAYVESEVLDAMVNNPRYSVEEVRRQANLVAGLEEQIRAKAYALYQSLSDDDYYDSPRPRRR